MKKRGQVTLFIILGVAVLIAGSIFIYVQQTTGRSKLSPDIIPAISEVPSQFRPIRTFTEECISSISEEAFRQLGDRGGYIDVDNFGITSNALSPTEADSIEFSPGSSLKIPYWWYLKSSNTCAGDCEFNSLRPPLYQTRSTRERSIEGQVSDYINEQLNICLGSYAIFAELGYVIEEIEPIDTTTVIGETDVSIFVEYPIKVSQGSATHEFERFYTSLPLNFKRIYELAQEITETEIEYQFLENQVLSLITAYASTDSDALPPKTESEFNFAGGTFWSETETKGKIESILMPYIGAIQIPYTINYESRVFPENNIKTAFYTMDPPVNMEREYDDLAVRFDYLGWWPIYFDLNCEGDICQPESANNPFLTFIGFQRYDFVYDISFPVVVDIIDPGAFEDGYSFKFALEANLRNNEAIDENFPGYVGAEIADSSTQLCDPDMKNSGDISVKVVDKMRANGAKDVHIMYSCGEEACSLGKTDVDGRLVTKFPVCFGGIVSFISNDYFTPAQYLDTNLDEENAVQAAAYPYVDKNVSVLKWRYVIEQNQLSQNPVDLEFDEEIVLSLKKISEDVGESEVATAVTYLGNQTTTSELLRIVPGIYGFTGTMVLHRKVVIPEEKRKTGVGLLGKLLGADDEITLPSIEFEDTYPSGGMKMNEETGYLTITADDLYNSKEIVFYAIGPSLPKKIEDVNVDITELSSEFRGRLNPTYVR